MGRLAGTHAILWSEGDLTEQNPAAKLDVGTRIRFVKTLDEGPDDYAPSRLFATKGDLGEITGHSACECYLVKTDQWDALFNALRDEFEVVT